MEKKLKGKNNFNTDLYWIITLIILVLYAIWLILFLSESRKEIKNIYQDIENKQKETLFLKSEIVRLKYEKMNFIFNLDLETDNSIYKYVTSDKSFNDLSYVPQNLELISSEFIDDTKWNTQLLRREANEALQKMWKDFYAKFSKKLLVISAYRSYSHQESIKAGWCPDNLCAEPWFSEHQLWLAIDILAVSTSDEWNKDKILASYYDWFNQNAYTYGFTNTYQKWFEIDWYEIEPWHWRYLWEELATYLKENKLTTAEFYNNVND